MDIDPNADFSAAEVGDLLEMKHLEVIRRIRKGDIIGRKVGWFWVIKGRDIQMAIRSPWYKKRQKKKAA